MAVATICLIAPKPPFRTAFWAKVARKEDPGTIGRNYAWHGARLAVVSTFLATTWNMKSIPTFSTPRSFV